MHRDSRHILAFDSQEPKNLSAWLNYHHSLTEKLQESLGAINLELLSQKWVKPCWWDYYFLQIKDDLVFQREIIMRSHGIKYWYARTIIPQKCYELNPALFDRLQKESVGNLIFGNNEVNRVAHHYYSVDHHCIEFYWVKKHINTIHGTLWVRFAEFSIRNQECFYLVEILFPELEKVH